ncbi:snail family zinc finger 1b [Electrophorus electricus]|uniref:C2H2-type domain-containing protein n=1 Tax=Electrophorus electricus TaxID=8005 RepID=A0A4W4FVJ1_ELEEL|nr:snail family zinc finger 1b [Electrophorus electricus]
MPRSFLVKKYFTNKKPNYSELESQNGPLCALVPERYPLAELPTTTDGSLVSTCSPTLLWSVGLPLYSAPSAPSPNRPLDLSSPSSSGEEDEGRTSDPPSPDPAERFRCGRCAKSCSSPAALSRHQLSHCAAAEPGLGAVENAPAGPAGRVPFRCKHCPKEYNSLGALKMHIRSHTLPCVCNTCGKAFSRPWLLRGHIRTHTGERPFSCPHCNRAFADRSNLRAHLQTHSEVKKYQCNTCSRTFSRMSLLHKHSVSGCCSSA